MLDPLRRYWTLGWGRLLTPSLSAPQHWRHAVVRQYETLTSASVDDLWRMVINVSAIASWHPLIRSTNLPPGLTAKPGLIYQVGTHLFALPIRIFVERVRPQELLSIRVLGWLGVEEHETYQLESTLWGTRISYSIELRGWLSPLLGSLLRPYTEQVVSCLAHAAEELTLSRQNQC